MTTRAIATGEGGGATGGSAADWLGLAAAPSFAVMGLLTGVLGGGPKDMVCSTADGGLSVSGMVPMYLLMSAFHSAPWLKRIRRGRNAATSAWTQER